MKRSITLFAITVCSAGCFVYMPEALAAPVSLLSAAPGDNPAPQASPTPILEFRTAPLAEPQPFAFPSSPDAPQVVYSAANQETLLNETGSSVTVITAEELERRKVRDVAEALRNVPGVDVASQGGPGQTAAVFMRGAASERTLLMVNGVEINDAISPGRGADLSKLTVDNVDRIEIVRGPQSSVYGSGAMGGVINIITRRAARAWKESLEVAGGKYSTWFGKLSLAGMLGDLSASLGASILNTDGFSAARRTLPSAEPLPDMNPNGDKNRTLDAGLEYQAWENLALSWSGRYIYNESELDNYAGDYGDSTDYTSGYNQWISRLDAAWDLLERQWRQKFSVGWNQSDRTTDNLTGYPPARVCSAYHARNLLLDWRHQFKQVVLGVNYRREQGSYHDENYLPENPDFPEHSAHTTGLYLEDRFHWEALTVDAGVRWDAHSAYGSSTTYRVTPSYTVAQTQTRLKASYGTAFNAPSLFQLYSGYGNTSLQPEESAGWEAGAEQPLWGGTLVVGATYFHTDFRNQIAFVTDPATYASIYENLGKVQTKGWEAFVSSAPLPDLDLRLTYTKLTANDLTLAETDGPQALTRRADYKLALNAAYRFLGMRASATITRVGPRWDTDFDPVTYAPRAVSLDPYTLINCVVAYELAPQAEIYARVNNLLDADYTETVGYNSPRFAAYAGVKLAWK